MKTRKRDGKPPPRRAPKGRTRLESRGLLKKASCMNQWSGLAECIGQHLGHVSGSDGCQMLDLMAATGARGHYDGAEGLAANLLDQRFGHFERQFVLLRQRAEGAGHAAASGIEQGNGSLRQALGEPQQESG